MPKKQLKFYKHKMRKTFVFLFIVFSSTILNAQKIDDTFIEGTWKVISVDDSPNDPPFSLMVESFKKATFIFNTDQSCVLKTSLRNGFFVQMSEAVEISTWSISEESARSSVLIEDAGRKVLEIFVLQEGSDVFFELGEQGDQSYFLLKVEKQ